MERGHAHRCSKQANGDREQLHIPKVGIARGRRRERARDPSSQQIETEEASWLQERKHQMALAAKMRNTGSMKCERRILDDFHLEGMRRGRALYSLPRRGETQDIR